MRHRRAGPAQADRDSSPAEAREPFGAPTHCDQRGSVEAPPKAVTAAAAACTGWVAVSRNPTGKILTGVVGRRLKRIGAHARSAARRVGGPRNERASDVRAEPPSRD